MSQFNENYYSVLNCDASATYEELKRNYQQLIKIHHPDKFEEKLQIVSNSNEAFQKIDRAWKTLRDSESRKEYDATLLQNDLNQECLIYANLSMDELEFNNENVSRYPCRCGSYFVIDKNDVEINKLIVIECSECTNCICVKHAQLLNISV